MTITARFPGRCSRCGGRIEPGSQIDWDKETKETRHAACPKVTTAPAAKTAAAVAPANALQPGEKYVSRPSRGRDDGGYEQGRCYKFRPTDGGGPDGHYWVVSRCGKRRVTEAEDDTREGEWDCWAHIRPATEAEAAPVAARIAAAEAAKAEGAALATALRAAMADGVDTLPAGCRELWGTARMAGSETWYVAPDGVVYYTRSDYDMGPSYRRTTATAAQVERLKTLGTHTPNLLTAR